MEVSGILFCQPSNSCDEWIAFHMCPENTVFTKELNFAELSLNCIDPSIKATQRERSSALVSIKECKGEADLRQGYFWCKFHKLCWFRFDDDKALNTENKLLNFETMRVEYKYPDTELSSHEHPTTIAEPTAGKVKSMAESCSPHWHANTILILFSFYIYLYLISCLKS